MFVRVFDKKQNRYYKSMVYATVGIGWFLQYIVLNPHTQNFELVDYLDKSTSPATPLVEMIQPSQEGFIVHHGAQLLKRKLFCRNNNLPHADAKQIMGYPDVLENNGFLAKILAQGFVPAASAKITVRNPEDAEQWNYILTQADADDFMHKFAGFHDSTLEKIQYAETDASSTIYAVFDNSCWFGTAELCFEGIQMLKILPATENIAREIFEASLIVENESIFWADSYMQQPNMAYEGSMIKALNLKWRKI